LVKPIVQTEGQHCFKLNIKLWLVYDLNRNYTLGLSLLLFLVSL